MQGIRTKAVVDTGAPYVICPPRVAREAGFEGIELLARLTMLIRGMRLEGSLIRLSIQLLAREGEKSDGGCYSFRSRC